MRKMLVLGLLLLTLGLTAGAAVAENSGILPPYMETTSKGIRI